LAIIYILQLGATDIIYALDLTAIGLIEKLFPGQRADFGIFEYQRNAADLVVRKNSLRTSFQP
jgi:hypothetical protein